MKKVLLTTSALVAFAGYAAAEVSFGGEVTVGYNDIEESGFYLEGELNITGTAEFDNGVAVEVTYGLDLYDGTFDDFPTVTVTTPWATLTVGEVEYAGTDMFAIVDGMNPGADLREINEEMVARVDATFGGFSVGLSFDTNLFSTPFNNYPTNELSIGAMGEFGAFSFSAVYDDTNSMYGVQAGTSFGGFDISVAYLASDATGDDSIGIGLGTTFGNVGLAAYYAINNGNADEFGVSADFTAGAASIAVWYEGVEGGVGEDFGVDVEYAYNDNINLGAGYSDVDSFYVFGTMMVGDATIGVSYNDDGDGDQDDDYKAGVDVWMTLPF
ncbi:porin [Abyssibius alkaniclasticus]|uniref:porin n=1 Tax=Abyssibius alkaniclasticus TaxID=2881234 RepID=UPI002363F81C|nr:porin [Abyssibius alkaniclasticus]UPH72067.1 porin [Abyssibius alkaniclasticus]